MILGGSEQTEGGRATLDDLFRRAGVQRAEALALIDPPNVAQITGSAPRRLSFAQADRAISAFAGRLRGLGLPSDAVVAVQLANTVDSVIALLGLLRAQLIAAPLPLLWRKQDMVAALARVGAKAIVTSVRIGASTPAETAMQAAAELFPIRHICGFGQAPPDGVTPLDDIYAAGAAEHFQPPARAGDAGAHVAAITFDVTNDGVVPVARSHSELIAGGVAVFLASGMAQGGNVLSTIPPGSFAGLATGVMPWLLGGGALALHHGFDPAVFADQCRALDVATAVVPGPAVVPFAAAGLLERPIGTILALWRAPEQLAAATAWAGDATLVDVASFGEIGLLPARRTADGLPAPFPLGTVALPRGATRAVPLVESLRTPSGTLALRGPMVPAQAFPPVAAPASASGTAPDGAIDTGFPCRLDRAAGTLVVTGPPAGVTAVGSCRFRQRDIDAAVATADPAAVVAALPDAVLSHRLAGNARERAATAAALQARGAHALIAGAFRPRGKADAA
jgi:hypothetical protein